MRRKVAVLAGGTGSVKLVRGFSKIRDIDLTVISNVGDNIWLYGLYVCPDIDTIVYGLSSLLDKKKGWGISDDTFSWLAMVRKIGLPTWFALGDKDLATHIIRTDMIRSGASLSQVTDFIRRELKIKPRILPASDEYVPTMIDTSKGTMHLQEFWVKYKAKLRIRRILFKDIERTKASGQAIRAILDADSVVIAPGNPITSISPIVSFSEIHAALARRRDRVTAVSPVIGKNAFSGPALKYLKAMNVSASIIGVSKLYSEIASSMLISEEDRDLAKEIREYSVEPIVTNIVMRSATEEQRLAMRTLGVSERLSKNKEKITMESI